MYDLIVIGDDLASHTAAALASHHGQKTVLIAESGIGGLFFIGDFLFNTDPTPLTGFGCDQAGHALMQELGIPQDVQEGVLLNPAYQIILPKHRIDFYNDQNMLRAELCREFPDLGDEINSYCGAISNNSDMFCAWLKNHPMIQPQSFRDCFDYLKFIPHLFKFKIKAWIFRNALSKNINFNKVSEAQDALLSLTNDHPNSFASHFRRDAARRGIYWYAQGKQNIFNSLIKKIESADGLYFNHCKVSSVQKGKMVDVDIEGKDGTTLKISARNLIISTKWEGFQLLFDDHKKINFSDWIRPADIAYYPFTIHMGVAQKCLPEKMARHLVVVSDVHKDIYDNNLIVLESSMPETQNAISSAKMSLTATVFLRNIPEIWVVENLQTEATTLIERLENFLPFLKYNIELLDINKSIDHSIEIRKVVNPKYKIRSSLFTGFAAKTNKTRYPNIYLTGASLLTDAGFDGEILSGFNAAFRVINKRR